MKKRRITRSLATVVMIASMLSGCGSSNTQSTTGTSVVITRTGEGILKEGAQSMSRDVSQEMSETASGKDYCSTFDVAGTSDLTLGVMITSLSDSDGGPYLRGVMENCMGMYPNMKLNPVEYSMNDLYTTLVTQAAAGTLPNVFTMTEAYSTNCLKMGMNVDDMDELLGEEYLKGLIPAAIENATADGNLVYISWRNNITAMVYRKDLFEEKGIQVLKTWDEFLEATRALTEDLDGDDKVDRYGCVLAGTRNDSAESKFRTFTLTHGCDFVAENGDGTFTSGFGTGAYRSAMTSFIDLTANKGATPPGLIEAGYSEAYTMMAADQACIFFSAPNILGGTYNASPEIRGKTGSFRMPTAEGVDPMTSFSSVGMTVSSTCRNPEVAADFLKYMTSVDNSITWNEAACYLPVIKSALAAACERDNVYSGFIGASDSAVIYLTFAGLAELRDICGECWQTVVSEGVPVDEAIAAAATEAKNVAKSYSN